jgi:hypothetical protein
MLIGNSNNRRCTKEQKESKVKELDKCIELLKKNGYVAMYSDESDEEYQTMYKDDGKTSSIDLNEEEIVFIGDEGDWLHLPCNYYALIGALIHFSQIGVGYRH